MNSRLDGLHNTQYCCHHNIDTAGPATHRDHGKGGGGGGREGERERGSRRSRGLRGWGARVMGKLEEDIIIIFCFLSAYTRTA